MKGLHFDCFSGISGDMTLGALIDAGVDAEAIRAGINSFELPIQLEVEKVRKGGFAAKARSDRRRRFRRDRGCTRSQADRRRGLAGRSA